MELLEWVSNAKFTGKGDVPVVCRMASEFAWSIGRGVDQAAERHAAKQRATGRVRPKPWWRRQQPSSWDRDSDAADQPLQMIEMRAGTADRACAARSEGAAPRMDRPHVYVANL